MYEITLTTNDNQKESMIFIVHVKYLKVLETLQNIGGLLRFNLSIIKRTRRKVDYRELAEWLSTYVFYNNQNKKWLLELYGYFDIKGKL